jgi:hypothetical protein
MKTLSMDNDIPRESTPKGNLCPENKEQSEQDQDSPEEQKQFAYTFHGILILSQLLRSCLSQS